MTFVMIPTSELHLEGPDHTRSGASDSMDFTSALYLGLRHPSHLLRPWPRFSLGVPAALDAPPDAERIARQIARLQGCESGVLGTSTLHLFWDLFGMLAKQPVSIFVDAEAYPIARWGIERATARGVAVREFKHGDPEDLQRKLRRHFRDTLKPIVVTDGFDLDRGRPAPLGAYLDSVREYGGMLVVDDTQALGIFGRSPGRRAPYGRGGGGLVRQYGICNPDLLVISSLAKAFGAPVAALSGSRAMIEEFKQKSETRVHCSPPSIAVMRAAEHALCVNAAHGDRLRFRLARIVMRFRRRAAHAGFQCDGGLFPVQTLNTSSRIASYLHRQLARRGIRTVLRNSDGRQRLTFVLTARHTPEAIDHATAALAKIRKLQASQGVMEDS
jgi:8-amino-7-oxononanoate synthase